MDIDYIPGIILILVAVAGGILGYLTEKKMWNNGICPETGESWVHFDTDSQGGRGYNSQQHYIWISWPVDK